MIGNVTVIAPVDSGVISDPPLASIALSQQSRNSEGSPWGRAFPECISLGWQQQVHVTVPGASPRSLEVQVVSPHFQSTRRLETWSS